MEAIFAFFDIVTFERFGEILNILGKKREISAISDEPAKDGTSGAVESLTQTFSSIIDTIQKLKSEAKSEIVNQFMGSGNGFSKLKQSCQVQRLTGTHFDLDYLFLVIFLGI